MDGYTDRGGVVVVSCKKGSLNAIPMEGAGRKQNGNAYWLQWHGGAYR